MACFCVENCDLCLIARHRAVCCSTPTAIGASLVSSAVFVVREQRARCSIVVYSCSLTLVFAEYMCHNCGQILSVRWRCAAAERICVRCEARFSPLCYVRLRRLVGRRSLGNLSIQNLFVHACINFNIDIEYRRGERRSSTKILAKRTTFRLRRAFFHISET